MDAETQGLLVDLFKETDPFTGGVPTAEFEIRHRAQLQLLNRLVIEGDVRQQQEHYMVELLTMFEIADPDVQRFVADCETVRGALYDRYCANPRQPVLIDELADKTELTRERFRWVAAYLNHCVGLASNSSGDGFNSPSSTVLPLRLVLEIDSFEAFRNLLQSYKRNRARWISPSEADVVEPVSENSTGTEPGWLLELPVEIQGLLREVKDADAHGYKRLAAMGIRAVIDRWGDLVAGQDLGTFAKKLSVLVAKKAISEWQRGHLDAIVELGHAAMHRGHEPSAEDVATSLGILERALIAHYLDSKKIVSLRANTPLRNNP